MYPINVKTAKPIRPNFFYGGHLTQGNAHSLKHLSPNIFDFCKILKIQEKIKNPRIFLWILFYIVQREDAHR